MCCLLLSVAAVAGCRASNQIDVPSVDADDAAAEAIALYDADKNGALSKEELAECPGVLGRLDFYDQNKNEAVEQEEISLRLAELLKHGIGATQLNCLVTYRGKPLGGAEVVFEPEPYLGGEVQAATATTNGAGSAQMTIPPEFIPEALRRVKMLHYGTFKVRITHPTIAIPARYNADTELGYETEAGNPYVRFNLVDKR